MQGRLNPAATAAAAGYVWRIGQQNFRILLIGKSSVETNTMTRCLEWKYQMLFKNYC